MKKNFYLLLILLVVSQLLFAQSNVKNTIKEISPRQTVSLDGAGWNVWLDEKASWENDSIYAPNEFKLANLPSNEPSCGWNKLNTQGKSCEVPVCIEQVFAQGNATFYYHGVSWVYKSMFIPADWKDKVIRLNIARARLRVEIYINQKLAGYDLCNETPLEFDLSRYFECGKENQIAIRITNPGGSRGFDDAFQVHWGKYSLPAGRDFSGVDSISLTVTNPLYISDVFVLNQLPANARNIEVNVNIQNNSLKTVKKIISVQVDTVMKETLTEIKPGENRIQFSLTVLNAKLWDVGKPNLYSCEVTLKEEEMITDYLSTPFGFRVFEVKQNQDGKSCFYLNGKRFRHRSAIDFGFYAHTGLFATKEMAESTVQEAINIGHNGVNLHRHIGEYRVLDVADKLGVVLYEEPGGMHQLQGKEPIIEGSFADRVLQEKIRRMAFRGRNHPSLLIHNLSNEDNFWGPIREKAMRAIHTINPAVLVTNASGHAAKGEVKGRVPYKHAQPSGINNHIRPYENTIREDFQDDHTVGSEPRFDEYTLQSHSKNAGNDLFYFGEVFCYTGPANWWKTAEQQKQLNAGSYDNSSFQMNHDKIEKAFSDWNLSKFGSKVITSPAEVSVQAGRSLMYADGRLGQRIMANNSVDGLAINGWTAHSYSSRRNDVWDSALLDEGRNLKGPAEDYKYWVNQLQIAIFRKNGKYFIPGDTAKFDISIINEAIIPSGTYKLLFTVTDGVGKKTDFKKEILVNLKAGDNYAATLEGLELDLKRDWHAGYITICGELINAEGKSVANGKEQVLLSNRPSFENDLKGISISTVNWPAAESALVQAKASIVKNEKAEVILAGEYSENAKELLKLAYSGATLVLKFDSKWGDFLYDQQILSAKIEQWGGAQYKIKRGWNANGWGYIDHFIGNQAVPSKSIIGTTGWEFTEDPKGFYPFESKYKKAAYGLYFARQDVNNKETNPSLLVLLATIDYGKGEIVLMPSYSIDAGTASNDLLFFNLINKASKKEW